LKKKEENDFLLNKAGNLPNETWRRLFNNRGPIKTKMRLNVRCLGAHSIFRLTSASDIKFLFEILNPAEGTAFVVEIPSDGMRRSYEKRTYLEACYIGKPSIEIGESLFFYPDKGQMQVVHNIRKIEILEEHPCFPK